MIPLSDRIPTRRFPLVTVLLILINVIVFGYELLLQGSGGDQALQQLILNYGLVPARVATGLSAGTLWTFITTMFLHASPLHIIGNMLYLWIFGNNIEDIMGHLWFLVFYFAIAAAGLTLRLAFAIPPRMGRRVAGGVDYPSRAQPTTGYTLLALCALLSLLAYLWYNVQFVQHQGRYLFTALIPFAFGFAVGWQEALRPRSRWLLAGALTLIALDLLAVGLENGQGIPAWSAALILAGAAGLAASSRLSDSLRAMLYALPFVLLPLFALYGLFGAIVPQLAQHISG